MVVLLLLLLGCSDDPLAAPDGVRSWSEIVLGGTRVGVVSRVQTAPSGRRVSWREARYLWQRDGNQTLSVHTSSVQLGARGQAVSAMARERGLPVRRWSGQAWVARDAAVSGELPTGEVTLLDPSALTVRSTTVARTVDGWTWTAGAGASVTLKTRPDGPWLAWGGLQIRPIDQEPDPLVPIEVSTLLRRPSPPLDRARSAMRASFRVGTETVQVNRPLWLEIPAREGQRLMALVSEVRSRLSWAPTPGSVGAMGALASGAGDCNEFAELFVGLARERGLRARPVSGLVYTAPEDLGPGLDLHAWAEVWVEPVGWVAVDPALDQRVADATHLPLARGATIEAALAELGTGVDIAILEVD